MLKSFLGFLLLCGAQQALSDTEDQARRMFNRLAGVPPTPEQIATMVTLLERDEGPQAAEIPLAEETFLSLTVKNMVARWTNVDESMSVPLNDFTATAIGLIRDDKSFDQVLFGDSLYTGGAGLPAYSTANNDHYVEFTTSGARFLTDLVESPQTNLNGFDEAAGVITSRAFGEAYFSAGTNRRAIAALLKIFTCNEMEQLNDVTRPDAFVRRDVDRAPGGDPLVFRNQCSGCHAGMDPLSKAFAHYDFVEGELIFDPDQIPEKINRNGTVFPDGYITTNDQWSNLWTEGQNAAIGWTGPSAGTGAKSLGQTIASTQAFSSCMAQRVFTKVCLRQPLSTESNAIDDLSQSFRDTNFNMKTLFANSALLCKGE